MKKLKSIIAMMLVLAMVLSLAGCGKEADVEENDNVSEEDNNGDVSNDGMITELTEHVTIEFWHAMSGGLQDTLEDLTNQFNEANEMITVELVNQGSYGDLSQKIMASIPADTLPDMAQVYNNWIANYIELVVELDDFVNHETIGMDWDDIIPAYREEASEFGAIHTIPFNKSDRLYFYNKTVYDELGLEAPTNWEELYDVSKTITEETGKPAFGADDLTALFMELTLQNGGEFITADGEVMFDSEEGIEALGLFIDMLDNGYARLAGEDGYFSGPLSNQDVYAYIGSSAGVGFISAEDFELGVAPLFGNVNNAVASAGTNLAMFTTEPEKQLATWEYMKFLASEAATMQWSMESGYLPVRTSVYENEEYIAFMEENIAAAASSEQVEAKFYEPATYEGSYDARSTIAAKLEEVLLEGLDAEEAVNAIAEAVRAELAR